MRMLRSLALLSLAAAPLAAQSSQFGVRGLGLPVNPVSVRATGGAGAFALFDSESGLNPATLGLVAYLNASFQTVQNWRHSESPAGAASARDNRFPGIFAAGPIGGTRLGASLSVSGYTDRNFVLASRDTIELRGVPVGVFDTLSSQGGLSDLRAGLGWRQSRAVQWGVAFHLITGSNRISSHRVFEDTAYAGAQERFTISYLGYGVSGGVMARVGKYLTLAGAVRADEKVRVERDTSKVGNIDLPMTFSGGARLQLGDRIMVAGSGIYRTWSAANKDIIAQDGVGSINTTELSGGIEYIPDPKRPGHHPLRFGVRHATLPFPLTAGETARETAVSIGTSFRFVAERAGLDFALQRVWRSAGSAFSERATLLTIGVSVRP